MPRRVNLPAADDLFRPTGAKGAPGSTGAKVRAVPDVPAEPEGDSPEAAAEAAAAARRAASGRVRHDEKMTVYVTPQELIDLEQARLNLRGHHGLAVDRGRIVREAIALVLHDLDEQGADSLLVRRLAGE